MCTFRVNIISMKDVADFFARPAARVRTETVLFFALAPSMLTYHRFSWSTTDSLRPLSLGRPQTRHGFPRTLDQERVLGATVRV